jgi:hypothetical protein
MRSVDEAEPSIGFVIVSHYFRESMRHLMLKVLPARLELVPTRCNWSDERWVHRSLISSRRKRALALRTTSRSASFYRAARASGCGIRKATAISSVRSAVAAIFGNYEVGRAEIRLQHFVAEAGAARPSTVRCGKVTMIRRGHDHTATINR